MARTGKKTKEMRQVSFRMSVDTLDDYISVAKARGVDLSALLNWVLVEYRPLLLLRRAEHDVAMIRAAAAGLAQAGSMGVGIDVQGAVSKLNELIHQLHEVSSKLSRQASGEGKRVAQTASTIEEVCD
jgi:hypothetical protein